MTEYRPSGCERVFPKLLFRQTCLLAFLFGAIAWRLPGPGLLGLALLFFVDWRGGRPLFRLLFLLLCFMVGGLYCAARESHRPVESKWLVSFLNAEQDWREHKRNRSKGVLVSATVDSVTPLPQNRMRVLLRDVRPASGPAAGDREIMADGLFVWNWSQPEFHPLPGQSVKGYFRFSRIVGSANPGAFDLEKYWGDQNAWWRARNPKTDVGIELSGPPGLPALWRDRLRRDFLNALPRDGKGFSEGAAFLPALIFGDRSFLSPEQADLVSRSTLAHSLALSGLHMGYCLAIGFALSLAVTRIVPSVLLRVPRQLLAMLLALPFGVAYLWIGQAPVSLQRAGLMLVFWALLLFRRRPKVFLDGLLAAVAVLILMDPVLVFDIRLQLSALCVSVIALSLPLAENMLERLKKRDRGFASGMTLGFGRALFFLFYVSLVIQIALYPLLARAFGHLGFLFPLNMIWLPVLGFVVMPFAFLGTVFAAIGAGDLARLALNIAVWPCEQLLGLLNYLESAGLLFSPTVMRPHWLFMAGYWLLCLGLPGLWLAWAARKNGLSGKRPSLRKMVAMSAVGVALLASPLAVKALDALVYGYSVRLTIIDVGQGQSVLLEWGNALSRDRALVDGGMYNAYFDAGKSIVAPVLTDNALPRLDAVICTHPDADHLGGLIHVVSEFSVKTYAGNGRKAEGELGEALEKALRKSGLAESDLKAGDVLYLDRHNDLRLEVLWPPGPLEQGELSQQSNKPHGNNASLVLRLVWQGRPLALLCGDIERAGLKALADMHGELELAAQVLVVPHHGSSKSVYEPFYEKISPDMALVSCSFDNPWRFPSLEVKKAMEEMDIPMFSTAGSGRILVEWPGPDLPPDVDFARKDQEREPAAVP